MKKVVALLLTICMAISIVACSENGDLLIETSSSPKATEENSNNNEQNRPCETICPTVSHPDQKEEPDVTPEVVSPTEKPTPQSPTPNPTPTNPVESVHKHSYFESVVSPTCGQEGYTLHQCSCGDSYRTNLVQATQKHVFEKQNCEYQGIYYEGIVCAGCKLEVCEYGNADGRYFVDRPVKYYITGSKTADNIERTLCIYGNGAMPDWSEEERPIWEGYNFFHITKIIIDQGVTTIGAYAFYTPEFYLNYHNVKEISIAKSVKELKIHSLSGLTSLKSLRLGEGVTKLGFECLPQKSLKNLYVPRSLTYIDCGLPNVYYYYQGTKEEFKNILWKSYQQYRPLGDTAESLKIISNSY